MNPFRTPGVPVQEKEEKKPMKVGPFGYTFGCASSLMLAGLSGEYLSRHMPESHASISSVFSVLCFMTFATYFGFRAIAALSAEK